MLTDLLTFLASLRLKVANRSDLLLEIAALRHQLEVLQRRGDRPGFRREDRRFWIWLSRRWPKWRSALVTVQPDTVVGWHRQGYRLFWRWHSRGKSGRPRILPRVGDYRRSNASLGSHWDDPEPDVGLGEATDSEYLSGGGSEVHHPRK